MKKKVKNKLSKAVAFLLLIVTTFITVFTGVDLTALAGGGTVARGSVIYYNTYIPGSSYMTHWYTVDGNTAYCIESNKDQVNNGTYGGSDPTFDDYPLLMEVLFYGYKGTGKCGDGTFIQSWFQANKGITLTDEQAYLYTHIAANYAYSMGSQWYGLTEQQAKDAGIYDWIIWCSQNQLSGSHLTGGVLNFVDPGGSAQKLCYISSYEFKPYSADLSVTINANKAKTASGNEATTNNAVYGLFNSGGTELKRVTLTIPSGSTTASGSLNYTFTTGGTYYVQEISAPVGYTLDTTKYYFTVDLTGKTATSTDSHFSSVNNTTLTFNGTDEVKKGTFSFTKVDEGGHTLGYVGFTIYRKSDVYTGSGYNFSGKTPVGTMTTNASGFAQSPVLEYGTYVVTETSTPDGLIPVTFEVGIDGSVANVSLGNIVDNTIRGKFDFKKVDEEGDALKGAEFAVYRKDDVYSGYLGGGYNFSLATPVCTLTTDVNGYAISPTLEYGDYVLHETTIPDGKLGVDFEVFVSDNNATIHVGNIVDKHIRGRFDLKKVDEASAPLKNAVFKIYKKDDVYAGYLGGYIFTGKTAVGTMTTDANGYALSPELIYGDYVVTETTIPVGKLGETFEVSIVDNNTTFHLGNVVDKTIRGKFDFVKVDEASAPLQNAGFSVYKKSDVFVGGNYDFSSATPVCTLTTDVNGYAISPTLEYGDYVVHETVIPTGKVETNFEVSITDNAITKHVGNVVDKTIRSKFSLTKMGDDGIAVENAGFSAYKKSDVYTGSGYDFSSATPVVIGPSGKTIIYTDSNGELTSEPIEFGEYVIVEVVVPNGYTACEPFEINVDTDGVIINNGTKIDKVIPAKLRIIKKDSETANTVLKPNATFKIFDTINNVYVNMSGVEEFKTDNTGTLTTPEELQIGSYRIEEVKAPEGYYLGTTTVSFDYNGLSPFINEGSDKIIVYEYTDTPKKGKLEFIKTGMTLNNFASNNFEWVEKGLPNATYELRAREDIVAPYDSSVVLFNKNDVITTITTDANGKASVTDLYIGEYYLVETIAPDGYVLDTTPVNFSITYNDDSTNEIIAKVPVFDEKQNVVLKLKKTDAETNKPLANAEFGLYADSDIYSFNGTLLVKKGELIKTTLSDKNGVIDFGLDLPYAKYIVKETKAPTNYLINTAEFKIDAETYPGSTIAFLEFSYSWADETVKGTLEIEKKGEVLTAYEDGKFKYEQKPLVNAKFEVKAKSDIYTYDNAVDTSGKRTVYYAKDELVGTIETDANGEASITQLPIGDYYLVEIQAPYGMYLDSTPIDFSIVYKDQVTPIVLTQKSITNERQTIALDINKTAAKWNYKLSGGKFELIATEDIKNYAGVVVVKAGTVLSTASANEGKIDFNIDLPHSKYKVIETEAPLDYYRNEEEFNLDLYYTDSSIKVLSCQLNIFDKRFAHFAKVRMVLGSTFTKTSNQNYKTGDGDTAGYSIILSDASVKASPNLVLILGLALLGLSGVGVASFVVAKRKEKVKAKKEREE